MRDRRVENELLRELRLLSVHQSIPESEKDQRSILIPGISALESYLHSHEGHGEDLPLVCPSIRKSISAIALRRLDQSRICLDLREFSILPKRLRERESKKRAKVEGLDREKCTWSAKSKKGKYGLEALYLER